MSQPSEHFTYDQVPYPVMSHSDTYPHRLATIAKILGINPTPVETCRVLELGCAAGGNIIPMAEALGNSTFVGVDNSQNQIDQARKTAEAIQLENVSFHAIDILEINEDFGRFDYIIAHGVYSWVPDHVRDKVMQICKQNLAPDGIAYISYNTLPGYHMLSAIREMLQWHTRHATNPKERFTQAVDFLEFLGQSIESIIAPDDAFGAFIRQYLENRFKRDASGQIAFDESLLHDELEANNQPFYFHQFMAHAESHGLQYIADVPFGNVMMHNFPPETQKELGAYANNIVELQQYADFINNRIFHRTLLCHESVTINRRITPDRIRDLYFTAATHIKSTEITDNIIAFHVGEHVSLETNHLLTITAFQILIEEAPQYIDLETLVTTASSRGNNLEQATEEDIHILLTNLLQAYTYKPALIEIFPSKPPMTTNISAKPIARPIARYQAGDLSQPTTTNQNHIRFTLDSFSRLVLPYLDGNHDHEQLFKKIEQRMQEGGIVIRNTDGEPLDYEKARPIIEKQIEKTIQDLAQSGILIG